MDFMTREELLRFYRQRYGREWKPDDNGLPPGFIGYCALFVGLLVAAIVVGVVAFL